MVRRRHSCAPSARFSHCFLSTQYFVSLSPLSRNASPPDNFSPPAFSCQNCRSHGISLQEIQEIDGRQPPLGNHETDHSMALLPDTRYTLLARLAEPADSAAWSEFVSIYEEAIFRYSRNRGLQEADAREVVQVVLLAVHQAVGDWQPTGRRPGKLPGLAAENGHHLCLRALSKPSEVRSCGRRNKRGAAAQ